MENNVLENAVMLLSRLQGIGPKSARRIMLDLVKKKETLLNPLITVLDSLSKDIVYCKNCFNIDVADLCYICASSSRNQNLLCVVEDVSALWAIEKTQSYNGLYFVLGGTLSAFKGINPKDLHIDLLVSKINQSSNITELLIATSSNIEGQITANYIIDNINNHSVKISMLAKGIPVGGELDYLDDITLSTAIKMRLNIKD
jgi:recombination protein RecR